LPFKRYVIEKSSRVALFCDAVYNKAPLRKLLTNRQKEHNTNYWCENRGLPSIVTHDLLFLSTSRIPYGQRIYFVHTRLRVWQGKAL